MIFVFLGPPGSGKGTQAKKLAAKLNVPHIALGDILREAVRQETEIGKRAKPYLDQGKLVPDRITISLTDERIVKDDCKNGFILDGYPRSIAQAEALDKSLKNVDFKVVYFSVALDEIIDRNEGRLSCPKCWAVYHKKHSPPKDDNKCDKCGAPLYQRKDDTASVIETRFNVYEESTKPLVDLYKMRGNLVKIDASGSIEEVFSRLIGTLGL